MLNFPNNFFFGSATSAHQVEGGNLNDWSEWEGSAGRIKALKQRGFDPKDYISGRACDHYYLYEKDFDIAQSLGQNAHRFSIEWSRLEPEEGKFNQAEIEHYRQVLLALRARGLEPFLTLWHWTMPVWLAKRGGCLSPDFPKYFDRFVKIIAENYFNEVKFWITLNEPMLNVAMSYLKGVWPPQKKCPFKFYQALQNLIKAHQLAYKSIHLVDLSAKVGIANNNVYYKNIPLIKLFWNHYFFDKIKNEQDFTGLNYYFSRFLFKPKLPVSDMNWSIYPKGIYFLLKDLARYNKPIYITENGIADAADSKRADFIKDHLYWALKAIDDKIDVRGYFYWSLLDNFEWDKGFAPRFGLVEVDYMTMERKIRNSALVYAEICREK